LGTQRLQRNIRPRLRAAVASLAVSALLLGSASAAFAEEWHVHDGSCYEKVLICERKEQARHFHSEACYAPERILVCTETQQEAHSHTEACYAQTEKLSCGLEESEGHRHGEGCYETRRVLSCALPESAEHSHGDDCYTTVTDCVCSLPESEGHTHTAACFSVENTLLCPLEEGEGHTHTDACYRDGERVLSCGLEEGEEHTHGNGCYILKLSCTQPEGFAREVQHENPDKDLETEEDWLATLPTATEGEPRLTRLVSIARSQLGYEESRENYLIYSNGEHYGYSRYGEWYGIPYGEWCAMFVSFCLHYAGIEEDVFPQDKATVTWMWALQDMGLYVDRAEHREFSPQPGDLVFFLVEGYALGPGHVGIVTEADDDGRLLVIEGNHGGVVTELQYWQSDFTIAGYGVMPGELREELTKYEAGKG